MNQEEEALPTTSTTPVPTTICKLCLRPAVLLKSHAIADAYFKAIKDKSGKLVRFDTLEDTAVVTGQDTWKEYMLCEPCEGQFSKLESKWIPSFAKADEAFAQGKPSVELPGFDYDSLKTYLLSILWRAAVAADKHYEEVLLTRHDQEQLRSMLLAASTATLEEWSVSIRKLIDRRRHLNLNQLLRAPTFNGEFGVPAYRFIFGGYVHDFILQKRTEGLTLLREGDALLLHSVNMTDVPEVMHMGGVAQDKANRGLDKRSNRCSR